MLEKFIVKRSVYDTLENSFIELKDVSEERLIRIHVLEEKLKAQTKTLKEADETIKLLKKTVADLTIDIADLTKEINEIENKPKKGVVKTKPVVVKKEVKKDGNKKEESNEKPVSKRGRPRKSTNN